MHVAHSYTQIDRIDGLNSNVNMYGIVLQEKNLFVSIFWQLRICSVSFEGNILFFFCSDGFLKNQLLSMVVSQVTNDPLQNAKKKAILLLRRKICGNGHDERKTMSLQIILAVLNVLPPVTH